MQLVDKLKAVEMDSANVTILDDCLGVQVEPTINHVAALNWLDPDTMLTNNPPQYDYTTYFLTAAIETDARLYVALPVYHGRTPSEIPRVKLLDDPKCTLTVIAPYTITDVDTSDPTYTLDSGADPIYPVDDGLRLFQKAQLAANFYGQQRTVIEATIQGVHLAYAPGSIIAGMVDAAGFTDVGTVVTHRVWDLLGNTTHIQTGRVEYVDDQKGGGGGWNIAPGNQQGGGGGGDGAGYQPLVVTPTPVYQTPVMQTPVRSAY
jgi:hypothetical protein